MSEETRDIDKRLYRQPFIDGEDPTEPVEKQGEAQYECPCGICKEQRRADRLEAQLAQVTQEVERAHTLIDSRDAQIVELEAQLAQERDEMEDRFTSEVVRHTRTEGQLAQVTELNKRLTEDYNKLLIRHDRAETKLAQAEERSQGWWESFQALTTEKMEAEDQLAQVERKRETLQRWIAEDGGAVKGYICHADLRELFALADQGRKPCPRCSRNGEYQCSECQRSVADQGDSDE